ncbi:T9SS type A sorting domain-containing protein [Fibrella arboris]|uniref:T9SS type A sorting domain-containing protein n=1 Tax=Fibrella arboris TaxID=3242486 RepID=UPI003522639D
MKLTMLLSVLLSSSYGLYAQTTLFQQNFSAGGTPANYVSSTPGTGQFNAISGATITNNTIQFDRSSGTGSGHFSRSTDLSPVPGSLYIQMDFEVVSATAAAGNNVVDFYVGSGFDNTVQNPVNADVYARFGFNFTNTGYQFSVRHVPAGGAGAIDSPVFTGKQTLTFVLNNTGRTVTYLQPGGGLQTLTDDTYDLWVGTTEVFNGLPVLTATQTMTDFKLRLTSNVYAAVFQFDNFLIRDINGSLPLSALELNAIVNKHVIELKWQSFQQTASLFTIERSPDAQEFASIGSLPPMPGPMEQRTYQFSDQSPRNGTNYYRIRQTNGDGSVMTSKIVPATWTNNVPAFTLLDNPTTGRSIKLRPDNLPDATYLITTLTGQPIHCQQRETPEGEVTLLLQHPLPSGVYLLTASTGTFRLTRRVLVD